VQEKVEREWNQGGTGREKPEEQESVSSHSETPGGFEELQEKWSEWEWWGGGNGRPGGGCKRLSLFLSFISFFLWWSIPSKSPCTHFSVLDRCQPTYDGRPTVDRNSLEYV